ncbi:MAG: glycosyltransferase family 1 protein [Cryobacterium sp.]|nr:glycosyltransferase family 1 protein [Cryobacterium sp.]
MTRPRLLILSFSDISADARVLKQVKQFAGKYEVTTYGYGPEPDPRVTHLRLSDSSRIHRWKRRDLILRRFSRMYWGQSAIRKAKTDLLPLAPFDVILANDIDTVGLALALSPVSGVHADIHEYAPRQNEELRIWRYFVAPYMRWLCKKFLPQVASMTTVGQGLADEYLRVFGVASEIVTNATPYTDLDAGPVGSTIRLVHSGASLRNRKLETLVDAVSSTTAELNLDLYLMGNDPEYIAELKERATGSARVRVLDPLPYAELIARLNGYDIGIHVIAPTNFNNHWSLPNKFFDYVQARLGLIIGPSPEMRRILSEYDLGAVTEDFSAVALTKVLDSLTVDKVRKWKDHANAAARSLSSETQVRVWEVAIRRILQVEAP